ncbi:MAG TPA: DNA polymerase III subunit delta [Stellaceae bacterium]|nr:DNA polymerase III subunit delta [Stellaceae bacterium]
MKLPPAKTSDFLKNPPADIAVALVFGPDEGLVRERADMLVRAVLGGTGDDPFRLALLNGDAIKSDPARLSDEATAISLMGGRRAIRVRDCGDVIAKTVEYLLGQPTGDSLTILEAGSLEAKSALRKLCENDARAVAIACYADGPRELAETMRESFGRHRVSIDKDAADFLVAHLGGDRMVTRQELEKLCLYAGEGGRLTLADVAASIDNTSALALDDIVYDAFDGRIGPLSTGLDRLLREGEMPVTILRAALRHAQRLHLVGTETARGKPLDVAIQGLRPPIFFKLADRFRGQFRRFPIHRAQRATSLLLAAERDCKRTGYPDETICRQALLNIVRLGNLRD